MYSWRSDSGRPLASPEWLEIHHRAKAEERLAFAKRVAQRFSPRRIVDLGCATGLWFEVFDSVFPPNCEFVGVDTDAQSLALAAERVGGWARRVTFEQADFELEPEAIPDADLTLAFNVFPYLHHAEQVLTSFVTRSAGRGTLIVRQYDGAMMRLGPMREEDRVEIEAALRTGVGASGQFKHYDLDRVFSLLATRSTSETYFELYQKIAPFSSEVKAYIDGLLDWMSAFISDEARGRLAEWRASQINQPGMACYYAEVDLVSVVS